MQHLPSCPSCRQPMEEHQFATNQGGVQTLDLCFPCQGIWFDRHENLKLAPAAVVELFKLLHEHRTDERRPLHNSLACPRCVRPLAHGFDMVRSGRYVIYRCASQHGRFATFSSFMVEKGFVRHMTRPEVVDLAKRVGAIYCTGCGAPVDIRKDHACPHCRAAFSLIDPEAVTRALQGYAYASQRVTHAPPPDLADALVSLERDRTRAERERHKERFSSSDASEATVTGDLLVAGVALVWGVLSS